MGHIVTFGDNRIISDNRSIQMQHLKILNKKEKKQILAVIADHYGINKIEALLDYALLLNKKNKMYLINNDLAKINLEKLKIDSIGMYFGEIIGSQVRLSIEGSQLIGKNATKNILEVDKYIAKLWLHGYDLEKKVVAPAEDCTGFAIIKNNTDFLGCGKITEQKILNFVSKNRCLRSRE